MVLLDLFRCHHHHHQSSSSSSSPHHHTTATPTSSAANGHFLLLVNAWPSSMPWFCCALFRWKSRDSATPTIYGWGWGFKHVYELVNLRHYSDVIMSAMASQITRITIVYPSVYSGADQRKRSKLRVTGLCEGKSPVSGEFPAQRAINAKNVSIWLRHHELPNFQYWMKIVSFSVWVKYFVWNVKWNLSNTTQNILPIHWQMCTLLMSENLQAPSFTNLCFWNAVYFWWNQWNTNVDQMWSKCINNNKFL